MSSIEHRDRAIGTVLESVLSISRVLAAARKRPFADLNVTPTQLDALFLIVHSPAPVTPAVLAARLKITRGAVTQLVDGLRQLQLVQHVPHPTDARSRLLTLTEDADATVRLFEAEVISRLRPSFETLTDSELTDLATLLTRLESHP